MLRKGTMAALNCGIDNTHFVLVTNKIMSGKVVPFLGAGVNLCDRPPGIRWNACSTTSLPSGVELAEQLTEELAQELPRTGQRQLVPFKGAT
jgi:hypothetical protein